MTDKLKPCPFCGRVPDYDAPHTFQDSQGTKWGRVVCCDAEVRTNYEEVEHWRDRAVTEWNTRPTEDRLRDLLRRAVNRPMTDDLRREIDAELGEGGES